MCTTAVDLDTRLLYYSNAPCTLYHGSPAVFGLRTSISMGGCCEVDSPSPENRATVHYAQLYGAENVRGGKWCKTAPTNHP